MPFAVTGSPQPGDSWSHPCRRGKECGNCTLLLKASAWIHHCRAHFLGPDKSDWRSKCTSAVARKEKWDIWEQPSLPQHYTFIYLKGHEALGQWGPGSLVPSQLHTIHLTLEKSPSLLPSLTLPSLTLPLSLCMWGLRNKKHKVYFRKVGQILAKMLLVEKLSNLLDFFFFPPPWK